MVVSGPREDLRKLVERLDFNRFVELVADILATRGHSNLRITDGPGDGCRDIHSITERGLKHLTQCKFHRNVDQTTSSLEVGQLALGMVKLDYQNGIFATNTTISPQAKREILNDYPKLTLDWIQGDDLAAEVFNNVILRSVWYDGHAISKVSYIVALPVVARDLERDKPLPVQLLDTPLISVDNHSITARLQPTFFSRDSFYPYREPKIKTISEGWYPGGRSVEIRLWGTITLDGVDYLLKRSADALVSQVADTGISGHFAIRFGTPRLTPLGGESPGSGIELKINPFTVVGHDTVVEDERDWLLPNFESGWLRPTTISAVIADWVRWYNADLDVCLNLQLLSPPDEFSRASVGEQQAYKKKWWDRSLFALVKDVDLHRLRESDIDPPSEVIKWYGDRSLVTWMHGNLSPGFRQMLIEPDSSQTSEPSPFEVDNMLFEKSATRIRARISEIGAEPVSPDTARHMIACVQADPFPSLELVYYRSVDLLTSYTQIPSPIDPQSREFEFTFVWQVADREDAIEEQAILRDLEQVEGKIAQQWPDLLINWYIDLHTAWGAFVLLCVSPSVKRLESTSRTLKSLEPLLSQVADSYEKELLSRMRKAERATKYYWLYEIGVSFPE